MLVLARKLKETVIVADVVQITVVEIRGDLVRLGITAPNDIPVDRLEVYLAKQQNLEKQAKESN